MSDQPLTNAAVEFVRRGYDLLNTPGAIPPGKLALTAEFTIEDRRSGGVNFGYLDASGMEALHASGRDVARGRTHQSIVEVLAIRGDRSAAYVEEFDYGDDATTGSIMCIRLNSGLRLLERVVSLDVDDRAAAIAELDRMHAEVDG